MRVLIMLTVPFFLAACSTDVPSVNKVNPKAIVKINGVPGPGPDGGPKQ